MPVAAQVSPVLLFTGTGYARLFAAGDRVAWWVPTPPRTVNYTTIIRYRVCTDSNSTFCDFCLVLVSLGS